MKSTVEDGQTQDLNENGKRTAGDESKDGGKKQKTFGLYRQPTAQELNRLQETENLFNSNLFRLQIDEILQEVEVKEKTINKFYAWFTNFRTYLLAIPEDNNEYDLSEKTLSEQLNVYIPISSELKKTKCMFKFYKFKDVEIVGSYGMGCSINSQLKVDLQITVPAETYTKNDSVNNKYHQKHAAYLSHIASHILKNESVAEVKYSRLNGSETKPVLDLKLAGKLRNHLTVRISLTCQSEAFKFHRFSPTRNNLRESWLLSTDSESTANVGPPTPYYNSTVLSDLTASANKEFLIEVFSTSENLKQAVVLLKIWLRQRKLQVSGHVVCLLVAYFVQIKRINNVMSSYQIVRNIWIALKTSEFDKKGISLHKGQGTPSLEEFHEHFPVVFIDCTGYYNICWQMCKGTYDALKRESGLAVEMLDNSKINSFIPLFMTPVKPLLQFDNIVRFQNITLLKKLVLLKTPKESLLNYGLDQLALVTNTIHKLLAKGLGNRVHLILQVVEADFSWSVTKTPEEVIKADEFKETLYFGLVLNTENAMNIVEKGPPANLPEAEQFRCFWGKKSELRRFQDGSITETCVWAGDTAPERRSIATQIVNYLLDLKYGVKPSDIFHIYNQFECLTKCKQFSDDKPLYVEECSLKVLQAFDSLRQDLRQLTQLPLDINAVYGVSPVFSCSGPRAARARAAPARPWRRGAACLLKTVPRPDRTHQLPAYTPVTRAVLELGYSGKWPGDIEAFRCLKAAFHLQIAERLTKQYSLVTQAYPTHLDVLKNGLVFRLTIAHPKEITLARKEMDDGVAKFRETEESIQLQCDTVLMPRLRGALHGLHTKHPAFGPTACLMKRWLSAHLLSPPHFPEVVAELLCAQCFLRPEPLTPPAHPTVGFSRALQLLADTDWASEVLVLDFNEDMTSEEVAAIEQNISSGSRPAMCIVTSYDGDLPGVWAAPGPSPQVLARAVRLARCNLFYMERKLMVLMKQNVMGAFGPPFTGYDVVVHLHQHVVPAAPGARCEQDMLPSARGEDVMPIVEFHPVRQYLEELRHAYSDFALFFNDEYGGHIICVLWKPDIHEYKDFQALAANALTPVTVEGETKYKVNTAALIEDFRILGEGLVKDINVN